jgi:hypothetical protein
MILVFFSREAVADAGIACAPVRGFHHALYANAGGYCTFDGLMVTAVCLLRESAVRRFRDFDLVLYQAGVPLAWNLAGGYQQPAFGVVELHVQTMPERARAYAAA